MRYLMKALIKGSVVIFPLLITLWMIWSALSWLNQLGLSVLTLLHLEAVAFPGGGLLIMLITLLGVGLLFQFNPVTWLYQYVEDALLRFPLVKTLYGAVKDFADMFDGEKPKAQQVVLLDMAGQGQVVGFVTSTSVPPPVKDVNPQSQLVAVYLPMSYVVGGYTLFVAQERLTYVDWSIEDAMRFALTAGVSQTQAKVRDKSPSEDKSNSANGPISTESPLL
jgi:uncharacterized membrane protein